MKTYTHVDLIYIFTLIFITKIHIIFQTSLATLQHDLEMLMIFISTVRITLTLQQFPLFFSMVNRDPPLLNPKGQTCSCCSCLPIWLDYRISTPLKAQLEFQKLKQSRSVTKASAKARSVSYIPKGTITQSVWPGFESLKEHKNMKKLKRPNWL